MINIRESFWTVPESEWSQIWVRVRWSDYPDPLIERIEPESEECFNLADLYQGSLDSEFAFRSLLLYEERTCTDLEPARWGEALVSPLLFDLDLLDGTQVELDQLLDDVCLELNKLRWDCRVFKSGVGYHVEVDPQSFEENGWCLYDEWADRYRKQVIDAVGTRDGAIVDTPRRTNRVMRMVGSANRKGESKTRLIRSR